MNLSLFLSCCCDTVLWMRSEDRPAAGAKLWHNLVQITEHCCWFTRETINSITKLLNCLVINPSNNNGATFISLVHFFLLNLYILLQLLWIHGGKWITRFSSLPRGFVQSQFREARGIWAWWPQAWQALDLIGCHKERWYVQWQQTGACNDSSENLSTLSENQTTQAGWTMIW